MTEGTGNVENVRSLNITQASHGPTRRRTQQERREQTRRALIAAVLDLTTSGAAFDGLSLRQVTQGARVAPSAFYRYFSSMDDLGLAVVEECFRRLRSPLAGASSVDNSASPGSIVKKGVRMLCEYVTQDHRHLAFVARQRAAGNPVLRRAVRQEIRLLTSQMATFLARFDPLNRWSVRDVEMLASLIVVTLTSGIDSMLEILTSDRSDPNSPELQGVAVGLQRQVFFILGAVPAWRST
ncbi:TetR family transcriptional regulator [Mycobacterium riyadhense]|uniref:HTH-type transcriptional repressor FabR n=1 Tax=Mycobacterium riyadhense TaxID=486698 RepID=A0A653EUI5_9MYCO|nr:TetR family transcriptional regulator [Mycobacterium riyadhense]VTP01205.1 HTH-type transcriptional repressor FabR [Mycobacterium riyadhense]